MNANEFIERYGKALYGEGEIDLAETYDLLRQQQAEIEALKAKTLTDEEIDDALSAAFNRGAMFGYAEGLKKVSSQAFTRRLKLFPRAGKKNKSFIGMLRGGK